MSFQTFLLSLLLAIFTEEFAIRGTHSSYPKGGVSFSKDSYVVNQTLVFQIKFCGKSPALRVAAKRYRQPMTTTLTLK